MVTKQLKYSIFRTETALNVQFLKFNRHLREINHDLVLCINRMGRSFALAASEHILMK